MRMNYKELAEFSKELKHLSKKYSSLDKDFALFKKLLDTEPLGTGKHFNVLTIAGEVKIVKARLFCQTLRGTSLRVIYSYNGAEIEFIEFIELYFKGNKEAEDKERIKEYLKKL
jgi:hypothetical protein